MSAAAQTTVTRPAPFAIFPSGWLSPILFAADERWPASGPLALRLRRLRDQKSIHARQPPFLAASPSAWAAASAARSVAVSMRSGFCGNSGSSLNGGRDGVAAWVSCAGACHAAAAGQQMTACLSTCLACLCLEVTATKLISC